MKNAFRKIAFTIAIIVTLLFSIPLFGCGETHSHTYTYIAIDNNYHKASCIDDDDSYQEKHFYQNNICKICNKQIKDLSDINDESLDKIIKELKSKQVYPYSEDYKYEVLFCIVDTKNAFSYLEEKEKALEGVKNSLTVRVYNASTGEWELQADEREIAKAKKEYDFYLNLYCGNILNLDVAIEREVFYKVIELFNSKLQTTEKINKILSNGTTSYIPLPQQYMGYTKFPEYHNKKPEWFYTISRIIENNSNLKLLP